MAKGPRAGHGAETTLITSGGWPLSEASFEECATLGSISPLYSLQYHQTLHSTQYAIVGTVCTVLQ